MAEIDTPKPVLVGLTEDKVAMGQTFLKIFKVPNLVSFHQCSIHISFICHRYYIILAIVIFIKVKHLKTTTIEHVEFAVQAVDEMQEISLAGCG